MNEFDKSVGIIGCGWLGTALAKRLLAKHYKVLTTTAHDSSAGKLNDQGINADKLVLPSPLTSEQFAQSRVFSQSQLVICLPPRLKLGQSDYPEKIKQIVAAAQLSGVKHIIMISSTAIYNGLSGKISEQHSLDFNADKVRVMYDAEQELLKFSGQANIIRLSGLIGPERHPGRFLSAKKTFSNPDGVVNLIHQQDAVGIIEALLLRSNEPKLNKAIYNGVSDTHVTRECFYQQAAKSLNLPAPQFIKAINSIEGEGAAMSKKILGNKMQNELGYRFIYNDLVTWLSR